MLVQVMTKIVLYMGDSMSSYEIALFRSVFNLLASSVYLLVGRQNLIDKIDATNRHILLVRCLSGSVCFLAFVVAIEYIPLSVYFVIMNATPFFIALLACLWLREMITKIEIATMIIAFGGILLVGMSKLKYETEDEVEKENLYHYNIGLVVAFICVIGNGVTVVATRRLKILSVIVI